MKEQVVTPRMSQRGSSGGKGRAGGGIVQKPARRERGGSSSGARGSGLRKVLVYLPLAGKLTLAVLTGVLLFAGYRAAASASFFEARVIDVNPTSRANAQEITRVVRRAAAQTGVWQIDLASVSAEIERLPWVRRAIVSRVLPDGLRVRVTERTPLAIVRTAEGKLVWVDEDAVVLDGMSSSDNLPAFFIHGWDERTNEEARADNRARVQKYLELARDWEAAGLSERVSEVNLADTQDIRVQLAGDDSRIEVRFLGDKNISSRLKPALDELDAKRNTPCGPFINYLLIKPNNSVIVGTEVGKPRCGGGGVSAGSVATEAEPAKTNDSEIKPDKPAARSKETKEKTALSEKEQRARKEQGKKEQEKREQDKREQAKSRAKGETRPRRVR